MGELRGKCNSARALYAYCRGAEYPLPPWRAAWEAFRMAFVKGWPGG